MFHHLLGVPVGARGGPAGLRLMAYKSGTGEGSISLTSGWSGIGGASFAPAENDLVLIGVGTGDDSPPDISMTTTGYTIEQEFGNNDTTFSVALLVAHKVMGASPDTAVEIDIVSSPGLSGNVWTLRVYRSVNATPMDVAETTANGSATGNPNPPSITPSAAGAIIVVFGAGCGGSAGQGALSQSGSELSNFTGAMHAEPYAVSIASGDYAWTSGAFDPVAWTGGHVIAYASWCAVTLALRPA